VGYDIVLLSLDLILHRAAVYRHILFNLKKDNDWQNFQANFRRLLVGVLFFTSYAKLYLLNPSNPVHSVLVNLGAFMTTCCDLACSSLIIALLCMLVKRQWSRRTVADILQLTTLSSFGHIFALMVVVWEYPRHFMGIIHFFSLTSTCTALVAYLHCSLMTSIAITALSSAGSYLLFLGFASIGVPAAHFFHDTGFLAQLSPMLVFWSPS